MGTANEKIKARLDAIEERLKASNPYMMAIFKNHERRPVFGADGIDLVLKEGQYIDHFEELRASNKHGYGMLAELLNGLLQEPYDEEEVRAMLEGDR